MGEGSQFFANKNKGVIKIWWPKCRETQDDHRELLVLFKKTWFQYNFHLIGGGVYWWCSNWCCCNGGGCSQFYWRQLFLNLGPLPWREKQPLVWNCRNRILIWIDSLAVQAFRIIYCVLWYWGPSTVLNWVLGVVYMTGSHVGMLMWCVWVCVWWGGQNTYLRAIRKLSHPCDH